VFAFVIRPHGAGDHEYRGANLLLRSEKKSSVVVRVIFQHHDRAYLGIGVDFPQIGTICVGELGHTDGHRVVRQLIKVAREGDIRASINGEVATPRRRKPVDKDIKLLIL